MNRREIDRDERARAIAKGKRAHELLEEYGKDFLEKAGREALDALYEAKTPDNLTRIWAEYRAARSLIRKLESEVSRGERARQVLMGGSENE